MAAILAFLLIKMTGVDREVIEKWLYVIVGLALFTGLLGTGHHYYWIGTPGYWQWIGSDLRRARDRCRSSPWCVLAFYHGLARRPRPPEQGGLAVELGCPVMAFFGAGVWGFMHTLHSINYYTHGTQVTAAHAPSRLLRRLRDAEPRDHHLRHAAACAACSPTTRCSTCGASGS